MKQELVPALMDIDARIAVKDTVSAAGLGLVSRASLCGVAFSLQKFQGDCIHR